MFECAAASYENIAMNHSDPTGQSPDQNVSPPSLAREFLSMGIVVGMLGVVGYAFIRDQLLMHHAETALIVDVKTTTSTHTDLCGLPTKNGRPIPVSMLYSDDKQAWIEDAAQTFSKLCPNIQVKLTVMGDIASADAMLTGEQKPTLWAPADDLVVRYLDARWKKEKPNQKPLFDPMQQIRIAASPMVVLMWKNRVQVLSRIGSQRSYAHGPWVTIGCTRVPIQPILEGMAISDMVPGTWIDWYNPLLPPPPEPKERFSWTPKPAKPIEAKVEDTQAFYRAAFPTLDQIRSWGRVKIGHTSPTRSAAGLEAIYLMAYDYVLPYKERPVEMLKAHGEALANPVYRGRVFSSDLGRPEFERALAEKKPMFGKWLRRCEAGLDPAPKSARLLTDTLFSVGEKRFDAVVTYEHLIFKVFKNIDMYAGTMATLEVLYPEPTVMNQHPVVSIDEAAQTDAQKLSAKKWLDYLRSVDIQKRAIEYGFRPVNEEVSIREYDSEDNPFLRYRRYGVDFDRPVIEPPRLDGEAVFDLVRIWEDATGRN